MQSGFIVQIPIEDEAPSPKVIKFDYCAVPREKLDVTDVELNSNIMLIVFSNKKTGIGA
jgi:hypothetical protein